MTFKVCHLVRTFLLTFVIFFNKYLFVLTSKLCASVDSFSKLASFKDASKPSY